MRQHSEVIISAHCYKSASIPVWPRICLTGVYNYTTLPSTPLLRDRGWFPVFRTPPLLLHALLFPYCSTSPCLRSTPLPVTWDCIQQCPYIDADLQPSAHHCDWGKNHPKEPTENQKQTLPIIDWYSYRHHLTHCRLNFIYVMYMPFSDYKGTEGNGHIIVLYFTYPLYYFWFLHITWPDRWRPHRYKSNLGSFTVSFTPPNLYIYICIYIYIHVYIYKSSVRE